MDKTETKRPTNLGNIELRHIRYFLAIADEMNFGRAAERLNIAQPGLSQQIKILEHILEATLFDRSRRRLRFTLAGEMFAAEARKVMAQVEVAVQTARRAARGEVGRLAIGYVGSAAYVGMLTHLVGEFRETHPQVELEISEMEMLPQLEAISDGRLDVGFIRPPVPLPIGLSFIPILQEELFVALPTSHPLASQEAVPLRALSDETFITPRHPPRVSFSQHTRAACHEVGFEPRMGPQGRDFVTIASMVSVGLGVALVPQSLQCIQLPSICYRPLSDVRPRSELAVAFRRSDASVVVRDFIAATRRRARSLSTESRPALSGTGE